MLSINITWKTISRWAFAPVFVGFVVFMVYLINSRLRAEEARFGETIPYTVILSETVYRSDGAARAGVDMTQAVRSDGSVVWRLTSGNRDLTQRIISFASGAEVTTNELAGTKSTISRKNVNPAYWHRDPNSKCINSLAGEVFAAPPEVVSGEEMVNGYRTVKVTRNNAVRWFALDYGCAMVKEKMDWGSEGSSEKNLVALIPGKPDTALFDVPAATRETPPSERMLGSGENRKNCGPECAEKLRKLDESYYKHRAVK